MSRPAPLRAVAALSLLAAMIHLWVMPEHFEEWWSYGHFFLVSAFAQGLYAPGLLLWSNRVILLAGVAGNLAIVILWLVTRTSGILLFGPHAGEVEEIGALDLVCTLAEVGIIAGLGVVAMGTFRRRSAYKSWSSWRRRSCCSGTCCTCSRGHQPTDLPYCGPA